MMRGAKVAALFLGYGLVGLGGDYAVGLLAGAPVLPRHVRIDVADVHAEEHVHVAHSGDASCAFEAERRVTLGASASQWLRLRAGSGELSVEGREGLGRVQAVGRACASDEASLAELLLTLEEDGGDLVLSAHYPARSARGGWGGGDYARLDLVVEVPLGMAVDLEDSSGSLQVRRTGELRVADSSGDIEISEISGSVHIDDSSGGIEVRGAGGDVEVEDGSGEVHISDVTGSVRLRDGSGSLDVEAVGGSVLVEADGSGSITVRDVGGDFRVRADGSGGIRFSGIGGTVDIPRDKREGRR